MTLALFINVLIIIINATLFRRQCFRTYFILFLLFINDLIECCIPHSDIYLFADDAKLFRHIIQDSDKTTLQKGVNALQEWTQEWFLKLNASKCMVMSFGRNVEKNYTYNILENSQIKPLTRTDQIKDLGILLDERLTFSDHINDKINKAFSMLGIIKRNFKHLTIQSFIMLYKNMVRSHLDYCSSVTSCPSATNCISVSLAVVHVFSLQITASSFLISV